MKFFRALTVIVVVVVVTGTPHAQYQSWIVGSDADVTPAATGGILLNSGGGVVDESFRWMTTRAGGGDIVVLTASGVVDYNTQIFALGANSVETIDIPSSAAAAIPEIAQKIRSAEALFVSGGDQNNYIQYWRNSPIEDAINYLINEKKVVVGGSSAGLAIQGEAYHPGGAESASALANPYTPSMTVGRDFLTHRFLRETITDSHYDQRDRAGRHVVMMARMVKDWGMHAKGIGANEQTAACVDTAGIARIIGPDYIYFIQTCGSDPEVCEPGKALQWDRGGKALVVYKVQGNLQGTNWFDLTNWASGSGGVWQYWYVRNGVLTKTDAGGVPPCLASSVAFTRAQGTPGSAHRSQRAKFGPMRDGMRISMHGAIFDTRGRRLDPRADRGGNSPKAGTGIHHPLNNQ